MNPLQTEEAICGHHDPLDGHLCRLPPRPGEDRCRLHALPSADPRCHWPFESGRRCTMPTREGSSLCVFHHRRSRRPLTKTDVRWIEGADDAA